jgi:hypothetical protein
MNGWLKFLLFTLAGCVIATAADNLVESTRASKDVALDTNPASPFWQAARPVYMNKDTHGNVVPGYRTEVRTRWTRNNLYLLFVCPYEELYLKAGPNTVNETNQLWNWDVATRNSNSPPKVSGSTWISTSINHTTKMVGLGTPDSKSPHASTGRRTCGMERCEFRLLRLRDILQRREIRYA